METTPEVTTAGTSRRKPEAAVAAVGENITKGMTTCAKCLLRLKKVLGAVYAILKSLIGLIIILIIYTLIGAALFQAIEQPNEQAQKQTLLDHRETMIVKVKNTNDQLQNGVITEGQWENQTRDMLAQYESIARSSSYGSSAEEKWTFYGALFFCSTVYTTIGYGNIVPVTDVGKILAIIYAITGIPLAMIVLAELGRKFTIGLKLLIVVIRRFYQPRKFRKVLQRRFKLKGNGSDPEEGRVIDGTSVEREEERNKEGKAKKMEKYKEVSSDEYSKDLKGNDEDKNIDTNGVSEDNIKGDEESTEQQEDDRQKVNIVFGVEIDEEFNLPPSVALAIMVIYLLIGCLMYPAWENWTFLDSFYFVFISMSTIGFGDILPAHPKFFLVSGIYLFIGLSLISMCINVGIEFFTKTMKKAKKKMHEAKDKMAVISKEKMSEVGKHIDKAKDKMSEVTDKMAEVTDKMAEEVKKNVENVQREIQTKTGSKSSTPVSSPKRSKSDDVERT